MSDMYVYMYLCMHVCTKSFLKTTTNSLCVCTHLANKADSDSDSDSDHWIALHYYFYLLIYFFVPNNKKIQSFDNKTKHLNIILLDI